MEKENVNKILEFITNGEKRIGHERSEEAILIIGPSGAGKSTLLATLNKLPLYSLIDDETGDIIIDSDQNKDELEGLIIEHRAQAGTALPKKLIINEKCFWDTPGFQDNKGHYQDLANAFFLRKIINTSSKIKLIFTIKHSHMEARAKVFLDSLRLFCKAFCGNADYLDSVGLIITNSHSHLNSSHISKKIEKNIINATELELDQDSTEFLKHFINNPNKIILMPTPNPSTDLTEFFCDFRRDVFELTSELESISISNPNLIINDETKNELPNIINKKAEGLEDSVKQAHQQIKNFLDNSFSSVKFDSNLEIGLKRVQDSKTLVDQFKTAKRNQDVEELYKLFKDFNLKTTAVENIKNTIECARLFSDINPKVVLETYSNKVFNIPDNLEEYYAKLEADLPLKLQEFARDEFKKWMKEFRENSKIKELEKGLNLITDLIVECSKEDSFKKFFKKLNTYGDLASKIGLKNLDGVIEKMSIFTDSQEELNSGDELGKMKDTLIKENLSKLEKLICRLKEKGNLNNVPNNSDNVAVDNCNDLKKELKERDSLIHDLLNDHEKLKSDHEKLKKQLKEKDNFISELKKKSSI